MLRTLHMHAPLTRGVAIPVCPPSRGVTSAAVMLGLSLLLYRPIVAEGGRVFCIPHLRGGLVTPRS